MNGAYDEAIKTLSLKRHQTDFMTGQDSDTGQVLLVIFFIIIFSINYFINVLMIIKSWKTLFVKDGGT